MAHRAITCGPWGSPGSIHLAAGKRWLLIQRHLPCQIPKPQAPRSQLKLSPIPFPHEARPCPLPHCRAGMGPGHASFPLRGWVRHLSPVGPCWGLLAPCPPPCSWMVLDWDHRPDTACRWTGHLASPHFPGLPGEKVGYYCPR